MGIPQLITADMAGFPSMDQPSVYGSYPYDPMRNWLTPEAYDEMLRAMIRFKPEPPSPQETTMPVREPLEPLGRFPGHPDTLVKIPVVTINTIIARLNALSARVNVLPEPTVAEIDEHHWETYAANLIHHLREPVGAFLDKDPESVTDEDITKAVESNLFAQGPYVPLAEHNRRIDELQSKIDQAQQHNGQRYEGARRHLGRLRAIADEFDAFLSKPTAGQ